jgi:hypothetical protein
LSASEQPILVNGSAIVMKGLLKSGDVISVMGTNMRWETNADLKRN